MFPIELRATFDQLWVVETSKFDDQLLAGMNRVTGELVKHGALHSSRACIALTSEATNSLPARAQAALQLLIRLIAAHGLVLNDEVRDDAQALIVDRLTAEKAKLLGIVVGRPSFKGLSNASLADLPSTQIDKVCGREIERIKGELAILATASATRSRQQCERAVPNAAPSISVQGSVGVIQTGPGSFGIAHQTIDQGGIDAFAKALNAVAEGLKTDHQEDPFDADELRQLVQDGLAETKSAKPNASKLKAIAYGVGGAISYAPRLKDAYETLKWAGNFIGLSLP